MSYHLSRRNLLAGAAVVAALAAAPGADAQDAPQGPRKRIAVAKFGGVGTFWAALGGTDFGDVLADQFSTVLAASGVFDVVDRGDVVMILKEQSLKPASATQGAAADNPADLLGAQVIVRGIDKQVVGQTAAEIRKVRPPEPYKGKGIRYEGEYVRRKVGKRA